MPRRTNAPVTALSAVFGEFTVFEFVFPVVVVVLVVVDVVVVLLTVVSVLFSE